MILTFVKGFNEGKSLELDGERIVLGRNADCQVVLALPAVSREHAIIRKIQGKFYIEDNKSRNGTFVNDKEVQTRTQLKHKDHIKICDTVLTFLEKPPPTTTRKRRTRPPSRPPSSGRATSSRCWKRSRRSGWRCCWGLGAS